MRITLLAFLIFINVITNAQIVSINPDHSLRGQQLTTTITAASGVIAMSSGPMGNIDIYLEQGANRIYATNYNFIPPPPPHSDSINAYFNIPLNAHTGFYDVHIITYINNPFPVPTDNVLTNGFSIGESLMEGDVYFDANQSGVRDTLENGVANRNILVSPGNTSVYSDVSGHYKARVDAGTYNINCNISSPLIISSTPSSYTPTVPPDTSGNDFGVYAPPTTIISQDFSSYAYPFRCNRPEHSGWTISSSANNIINGVITVTYSANMNYLNSTVAPTSHIGNVVRWAYQLQPYATLYSEMTFVSPPANNSVYLIITDSIFDNLGNFVSVSQDNYYSQVRCSMDPNDKHVSPEGIDSLHHYTLKNEELTYTIRFQNCGTDTAFNVIVEDALDANLDLSTFQVLSSSFPVTSQMDASGLVRFYFDNIMLPDSNVDELNSHGYVIYKITPKSTAADSTVINNTAYIYFDFNTAVVTNTTFNTLVTQLQVGVNELKNVKNSYVYPNPVTGNSTLLLPANSIFGLHIYDSTGREVINKIISENYTIQKNKFKTGIYYYQLVNINGDYVNKGKFVVVE